MDESTSSLFQTTFIHWVEYATNSRSKKSVLNLPVRRNEEIWRSTFSLFHKIWYVEYCTYAMKCCGDEVEAIFDIPSSRSMSKSDDCVDIYSTRELWNASAIYSKTSGKQGRVFFWLCPRRKRKGQPERVSRWRLLQNCDVQQKLS